MSEVLRPANTLQHDLRIDDWLNIQSGEVSAIARELVRLIRFHAVGGTETLHEGRSVTGAYVYVAIEPEHVRLGFFHGAALLDPDGILTAGEGDERYVKLVPRGGIQAGPIIALIEAAYDDMALRASGTH